MSSFPKEKREKKKASFKSGGGKMQGFGKALGCVGIAILIGAVGPAMDSGQAWGATYFWWIFLINSSCREVNRVERNENDYRNFEQKRIIRLCICAFWISWKE